jgi:RNA polymerase sigma-70 factor, ECF subfamily
VDPQAGGSTGERRIGPEPYPAGADERELVASVLQNDRKAAARLIAAHIDAVYAFVRQRLRPCADLVDDVVQDVFLAALRGLSTYQGQSALRTWLLGIARHKVEDVYRQRLRLPEALDVDAVDADSLPEATSPEDDIDAERARDKTQRVLAQLPERYSLLLLWRYWEQRSADEMATAIGVTVKSVERTLARARGRFRELWLQE